MQDGVQIPLGRHAGRRVEIPYRQGYGGRAHPFPGALEGGGVVPAGDPVFGLPGDLMLLRQGAQQLEEPPARAR